MNVCLRVIINPDLQVGVRDMKDGMGFSPDINNSIINAE